MKKDNGTGEFWRLEVAYINELGRRTSRTAQEVHQSIEAARSTEQAARRRGRHRSFPVPYVVPLQADWVRWTIHADVAPMSQIYGLRPTLLTIANEAIFFVRRAWQWLRLLRAALALRVLGIDCRSALRFLPHPLHMRRWRVLQTAEYRRGVKPASPKRARRAARSAPNAWMAYLGAQPISDFSISPNPTTREAKSQ